MGTWGPKGERRVTSDAYWRQPLTWAKVAGHPEFADQPRPRVFCASLADVFESRRDLIEPRARLVRLIYDTPELDWLILTKRPAGAWAMWREACRL